MSEVSKVVCGGETVIDLTNDTVTPQTLAKGYTAHGANGEQIEGEMPTETVLYTPQTLTVAQKTQARTNIGAASSEEVSNLYEEIAYYKNYVTPQMFGAKADGVTDDTAAVQAALDNGGLIYFPAGRYKVTSLLTVSKSCRIEMFKQYPSCWVDGDKGNYPLTADDNWMGSRIESYSPNGGMVLGSNVEVDGLYLRAMSGFAGVLLTYDDTVGVCKSYPTIAKLSHIRLDINSTSTIVESMFDYYPNGAYNCILEDINIGRARMTFCRYGFRCDLTKTSSKWASDVFIRNLCIDMHADYPLYIDGGNRAGGWLFEGVTIQAYNYDSVVNYGVGNGRTGHKDIVTLKNLQEPVFLSCYLWDLYDADYDNIFTTENLSTVSCIGCSTEFEDIDTAFKEKMALAKNFSINSLSVDIDTDFNTGDNTIIFGDGIGNTKQVIVPSAVLSDEQVGNGVEQWMDKNATPTEVVGRNKLNLNSSENFAGYYSSGGTVVDSSMFTTHYIEAKNGETIRSSLAGSRIAWYSTVMFDKDKKYLGVISAATDNSPTIDNENCAYIRNVYTISTLKVSTFEEVKTVQLCITIDDSDTTWTPYEVETVGGMANYLVLSSPNGTKYTLAVSDNGFVVADPVGDGEAVTPDFTLGDEDKNDIVDDVLTNLQSEEWTFTLADGSTVTKKVVIA